MTLAPYLLWILILPVTILLTLWSARRDRFRMAAQQKHAQSMLAGLQEANATVAEIVAVETNARATIKAMPFDIHPLEAETALRAVTPDWSDHDRYVLAQSLWAREQNPQALQVLAGVSLRDMVVGSGSLRSGLWPAIGKGGAGLLDQIAGELERQPPPDELLFGLPGLLENAAKRIEPGTVSKRLRRLGVALLKRVRAMQLAQLEQALEQIDGPGHVDPEMFVRKLTALIDPTYPKLMTVAQERLALQRGEEWGLAPVKLDAGVLQKFGSSDVLRHFDKNAAVGRLATAIASAHADTSSAAAGIAADHLGDYFFQDERRQVQLRAALDEALLLHEITDQHLWLDRELDPDNLEAGGSVEAWTGVLGPVSMLADLTATDDPATALAELRQVAPQASAATLQSVLMWLWSEEQLPIWLVCLAGVALEAADADPVDGRLMWLSLHRPLRHGSARLVDEIVDMIEARVETLGPWAKLRPAVRDLEVAAQRLRASAPETASAVEALLAKFER